MCYRRDSSTAKYRLHLMEAKKKGLSGEYYKEEGGNVDLDSRASEVLEGEKDPDEFTGVQYPAQLTSTSERRSLKEMSERNERLVAEVNEWKNKVDVMTVSFLI